MSVKQILCSPRVRRAGWTTSVGIAGLCLIAGSGCSADAIRFILGLTESDEITTAVAVVLPNEDTTAAPGAPTTIRWADIAKTAGTTISVVAQKRNDIDEDIGDPITLLTGRDALEDGEGDIFEWDLTGVRVGSYAILVTIASPDGTTSEVTSNGRFLVTTALPVPELSFTAPGTSEETVAPGDTFEIEWTDNGAEATEALVTLGLDVDFDHTEGDEVILFSNQALSTDGDSGMFTFNGVDENGDAVPPESYIVFAIVDDGANEIVNAEAEGHLVVEP